MRATGSPGIRSMVSMTTKITPSSTGMVSTRRRTMKISMGQAGAGGRRRGDRPTPEGRAARRRPAPSGASPAPPRAARESLLVDPGLPEAEVVLDRVDDVALDVGPGDHDLLGVVDRDPERLLREDVLYLAVDLLPLRLVQAPPARLQQLVH